jgi:Flp pilus assembly protein TadG
MSADRPGSGRARLLGGVPGRLLGRWLPLVPRLVRARVRPLVRPLAQRNGTAAVELALTAPMLMILFAGIIDFARAYDQEIELSSAVASASQYALLNVASINSTSVASLAATLSGIVANSNGAGWASATVTVNDGATSAVSNGVTTPSGTPANANSCWCPSGGGSVAWGWGVAATCGSACAGGTLAGKFVTITGTRAFTAIFGAYGLISNTTLHQSTIVQAQ